VVNDEDSLQRFFRHAIEEDELAQTVHLLAAGAPTSVAAPVPASADSSAPATPIAATSSPAPTAATSSAAAANKSAITVAAIDFPASSMGDALLQVRPVVVWGKDQISVSAFVLCTPADTPSSFLFSYSKRVFGSLVLDFALSSPSALKVHVKGDVVETGAALAANAWQHVVLSFSSRDGTVTLYINGSKVFSASKVRAGATLEQGGAFILANTPEGGAHAFAGTMAEVSVWKCALDRDVVKKMSQKPVLTGSEDALCLYFNFKGCNDDDSSVVLDVSSDKVRLLLVEWFKSHMYISPATLMHESLFNDSL